MKTQDRYKFRGLSVGDLSPWIYGYYHYDASLNQHFICDAETLKRHEVRGETVGMFTGHFDSRGNEIYDGDLFKHDDDDVDYIVCEWHSKIAQFQINAYGKAMYHGENSQEEYSTNTTVLEEHYWVLGEVDLEITGNIHQP